MADGITRQACLVLTIGPNALIPEKKQDKNMQKNNKVLQA